MTKRRTLILLSAGLLFLLFLHTGGWLPGSWVVSRFVIHPIQRVTWKTGVFFRQMVGIQKSQLLKRTTFLEEDRARLLGQGSRLAILEQENTFLRGQLGLKEKVQRKFLVSQVIGRTLGSEGAVLLLDRGSRDGVQSGFPVIVQDGVMIGKITRVEPATSHLQLLTHPQSHIAAMLLNDKRTSGLLEGERGLSARMTLIPREYPLRGGEVIATSGLEPFIPPGLFLGTVERITTEPSDLFQTTSVTLPLSFDSLLLVSIVLPE